MKNYLSLKILDLFKFMFPKDVDYQTLRRILQLKMVLDSRSTTNSNLTSLVRKRSLIGRLIYSENKQKKERNKTYLYSILYLILGGFYSLIFLAPIKESTSIGIVITLYMIFLSLRIITIFSTSILNTTDTKMLLPRPVDKKTLSVARALYSIYYIAVLAIAMMIIPIIVSAIVYSIVSALILLVEVILVPMFIVGIVAVLYYFVLKYFDGEKLKDILTLVQILIAAIIFILSHFAYLLEAGMRRINDASFHTWFLIAPTYWYVAPYDLLEGNRNTSTIIATVIGVALPILIIGIYISKIEKFEAYLAKLDKVSKGKLKKKNSFATIIKNMICRNEEEKIFFEFSASIMKNEREFKKKVYPQIIQGIISPIFFIFIFSQNQTFQSMKNGYWFLVFYIGSLTIVGISYMIKYSASNKGAWIYNVVPLKSESSPYTGALKAFAAKFIIPVLIVYFIIIVVFFGVDRIPDAVSIIAITLLAIPVNYKYSAKTLPFSVFTNDRVKGKMGKGLIVTVTIFVAAILQFLFDYFIPFGSYIFMAIAVVACSLTWRKLFE
ncbi:MAG: hypothetical protein ACRCYE_15175 [Sarcina sp.]